MFFFVRKINSFLFVGFEFWQGYHAISCGQFPFSLHICWISSYCSILCSHAYSVLYQGKRKTKACETNETKKGKVSEHEEIGVCTVPESSKD
ncbi:hypothetical protein Hanom_Chr06g00521521 [Helianthus anomalus]